LLDSKWNRYIEEKTSVELFSFEEWSETNFVKEANEADGFGIRGAEVCWVIPKWNSMNMEQTAEVYQERFVLSQLYIMIWIGLVLLCTILTVKNYFSRYRAEPAKVQTIQLTSTKSDYQREVQMLMNLEDTQKLSFYHADRCGIKRLDEVTPVQEEDLIPDEPTCGDICMIKLKLLGGSVIHAYNRLLYIALLLLHNIVLWLEIYFLSTIKLNFYSFAVA